MKASKKRTARRVQQLCVEKIIGTRSLSLGTLRRRYRYYFAAHSLLSLVILGGLAHAQKTKPDGNGGGGGGGGGTVVNLSVYPTPNPSSYGSTVTISITASPSSCGQYANIPLTDNGTSIGSVTLNSSGNGTYTTSTLAVGSHTIQATYYGGGSLNCIGTTKSATETVNASAPTISVSSSENPSTYGDSVLFTATISPSADTNIVSFSLNGILIENETPVNGTASVQVSNLPGGSNTITATIAANGNYAGNSTNYIETTNKASTSVSWTPPAPISYGTALSSAQLNAVLSVPGTCAYSPGAGTVLSWGTQTLTASCTPNDTTDYNTPAPVSVPINVVIYDTGTVSLNVNNILVAQTNYGAQSTPDTVAAGLVDSNESQYSGQSPVTLLDAGGSLFVMSKSTGSSTDYPFTISSVSNYPSTFSVPSFEGSPASGSLEGGADASSGSGGPVYSYQIPSYSAGSTPSGYDAVGNVVGYSDSVNGTWGPLNNTAGFSYDTLNRVTGSGGKTATGTPASYCWSYDAYGNRTINYNGPCSDNPPQTTL